MSVDTLTAALDSLDINLVSCVFSSDPSQIGFLENRVTSLHSHLRRELASGHLPDRALLQRAANVVANCAILIDEVHSLETHEQQVMEKSQSELTAILSSHMPLRETNSFALHTPQSISKSTKPSLQPFRQPTDTALSKEDGAWRNWFINNIGYPYPSKAAKEVLASAVPDCQQLKNIEGWFTNIRRRSGWLDVAKKYGSSEEWSLQALVDTLADTATAHTVPKEAKDALEGVKRYVLYGGKDAAIAATQALVLESTLPSDAALSVTKILGYTRPSRAGPIKAKVKKSPKKPKKKAVMQPDAIFMTPESRSASWDFSVMPPPPYVTRSSRSNSGDIPVPPELCDLSLPSPRYSADFSVPPLGLDNNC